MNATTARAVHALMQAAYLDEAVLIGARQFPPLARTCDDLANASTAFFGAWTEGRLHGVVEIDAVPGERVLAVHALCVARTARRGGVGRDLVRHVQEIAGRRAVKVSTAVNNAPAIALYRSLGFERVAETVSRDGIGLVDLRWVSGMKGH